MSDVIIYKIRIRAVLGSDWSDWLAGMSITPQANGETIIIGPVRDQAELFGLLNRIRDLGIPLLAVEPLPIDTMPSDPIIAQQQQDKTN